MKHKQRLLTAAIGALALVQTLGAQTAGQTDSAVVDLCSHITENGKIVLSMPDKLRERMRAEVQPFAAQDQESQQSKPTQAGRAAGYRIQVFSDNNSRTAKGEARSRARNISSQFPDYQTYVVYSSPYWRLRVGNFRSSEEATRVADELKIAFPAYAREIRVVRDRITVEAE